MVDKFICLGCCLDYQAVARKGLEAHPFADLFLSLAATQDTEVESLRRVCLLHQATVLDAQEARQDDPAERKEIQSLRRYVAAALEETRRDPGTSGS
ncbi:MAG: hypothetical protein EDX89_24500 [Acidobacteria bacterium]|nr:MAG: hypothetical protein EDX89_24500 [Acidobacteriota bacterium]MCE7959818.1 hypothetical protein [Acidobacteria bacterium ACB2]